MMLFRAGLVYWILRDRRDFDRYLTRPLGVLYQFFFTNINIFGVTDLIPGILVFIYGCVKCEVTVNLLFILQVVVILVGATLIRGGIYILLGSTSFHTRSAVDFGQYTQEIMDKTTMYPLSMYPESMQFILTYRSQSDGSRSTRCRRSWESTAYTPQCWFL